MTRPLRRVAAATVLALTGGAAMAEPARLLSFSDLDGWDGDAHAAAARAFVETCPDLSSAEWRKLCAVAQHRRPGRAFFEMFFRPVQIGVPPALLTGYYEPEIAGALRPDDTHRFPIYRRPPGLPSGARWASRAEIENDGLLAGRGLEIAWLADPVERFFLQIQGSGRIRLPDGGIVRVGYGGKNGHDYRSVGQELVRRGLFEAHEVSADAIAGWVRANPAAGRRLLQHNPSYVFFRRLDDHPAGKGPLGAMNRPLTPGRSIAVDPDHVPLGAPVWLEKGGATPLRRLMVAQDTGSAIQGAQRADIFYGTGAEAGRAAGRVRDAGRLVVLLPVRLAHAVTAGQ